VNINSLNTDSSRGLTGAYSGFELRGMKRLQPQGWRPIGPKAGWGSWPHQLEGLGECCKLPQWGLGHSPGRQAILPHLKYSGRPLLIAQDA